MNAEDVPSFLPPARPVSNFGRIVFSRRPFIIWALTPFLLLFAIAMPLLITEWTLGLVALMAGLELLSVSVLVGFWAPPRVAAIAFRTAASLVFVAYAAYLIAEFAGDKPLRLSGARSDASPRNALLGFIIIGLPSLCYAALGRFTLRKPPPEDPDEDVVDDDDEIGPDDKVA